MKDLGPIIQLDTRGLYCPLPLLRLGRTVRDAMQTGVAVQTINLLASDPKVRIDVPIWCADHGIKLIDQGDIEGGFYLKISVSAAEYIETIL